MKKTLSILAVLVFSCAAYCAAIALEVDCRHSKIKCLTPEGMPALYPMKGDAKPYFIEFRDKKEVALSWTEYSVSFTPDKSGYIVLGLCTGGDAKKNMNDWIEFDKLELTNATLKNPSFEFKSVKGDLWGWRYYSKESPKVGKNDAACGKNYIAVTRSFPARQGMNVTKGKKVTLKFRARSGGTTPKKEYKITFYSDQTAAKAK